MTTTIQAIRRATLLGVFAAALLATATPRTADGHDATDGTFHRPEPPRNLRVQGIAGPRTNAVVVSWEAGHSHQDSPFARAGYWLTLHTSPLPPVLPPISSIFSRSPETPPVTPRDSCLATGTSRPRSTSPTMAAGCRNFGIDTRLSRFALVITGLMPGTTYHVRVLSTGSNIGQCYLTGRTSTDCPTATELRNYPGLNSRAFGYNNDRRGVTATVTEFGTELPDPVIPDPETPTTPDPETPDCTYEHRLAGIPGSTANAYTARILVSSKEPNATATIRAYQHDNGHPIDVLDEGGSAVGATTSLAPAHSVKRFRLEDARGWHTVIVEHPTARAMRRAAVTMMLRGPDVGVQIVPVQGIEDCTPASTTTE